MIRTERVLLRRARPEDVPAFHAIMTDIRVMRYWSEPPHATYEKTEGYVAHMMRSDTPDVNEYVVELDGRVIGKAGCWRPADFGYLYHPDVWGQGIATEVAHAVIPRCFEKFKDIDALTADCDPRNSASMALLRRMGFRHLRTVEKDLHYGGIEWCDTAYFDLPRPEA